VPAASSTSTSDRVGDLGAAILAALPADAGRRSALHREHRGRDPRGVQLAVAQTFWLGVGAAIISAIAAAFMHEHKLRTSDTPVTAQASAPEGVAAPATE
jgi:hypothetical protein